MDHPLNIVDVALEELDRALGRPASSGAKPQESLRARIEHLNLEDDSPSPERHTRHRAPIQEEDMAARLTNLESQVSQLRVDVAEVKTKVSHIETDMLTKGRAAIFALVVTLSILGGGWWVVQQYLAPLLQAAGAA